MVDFTSIGLTGLLANSTSLATTSHNIVNLDKEGYSRQLTGLGTNAPVKLGGSFVGQGVHVDSITRASNRYVVEQLRKDISSYSSLEAFSEYSVRIDRLLGDESTAIAPSIQSFFDSLQDLASDPSSVPNRQVLLSNGEALVNRFNAVYNQVYQANETLNTELETVTSKVTQLAGSIASYNKSIQSYFSNSTGSQPNDLMDQRDQAVRELSELVGIDLTVQENGSYSIFVGSGQALVIDQVSYGLETGATLSGLSRDEIFLTDGNTGQNITGLISGGRIGGLLSVRSEVIDPVLNELGRIAMTISETINDQHELGMDLDSQLGGLFFSDINGAIEQTSRAIPATDNTGTVQLSVTIDDVGSLQATSYRLKYDVVTGTYTLFNRDNTVHANFADPGAGGTFVSPDGFTINFDSGAPIDGDTFEIFPTRFGAGSIDVEINDVRRIAAALPITTSIPATNIGKGFVEDIVVDDTTTADFTTTQFTLTPPYEVQFTSATTYDVIDTSTSATVVASVAFTPSQSNGLLEQAGLYPATGYDVIYNGVPSVGDIVQIQYNAGGVADNRNLLRISALSEQKTIATGTATFQAAYAQLVSGVGTRTKDAELSQEAAESIMNQSQAQWETISGVSLDEEAANLIRFQQAYQASARVIQVSSELFDSILQSL